MPALQDRQAEDIETALGYRFKSRNLMNEALTHSSASRRGSRGARTNERLEFLGDRVLGLAIAELLMRRYPHDPEGALSARLAVLVSEPVLADVARSLDLGRWLEVARSEEEGGGREKPGILADAVEAMIGGIFLDGGWERAAEFVRHHFASRLETMSVPPRDAKSLLQEWSQARGLGLPTYEVKQASGPAHAPIFHIAVSLPGYETASARAPSKRAAETAAAEALLDRLSQAVGGRNG
jgi:ribonuclease-3